MPFTRKFFNNGNNISSDKTRQIMGSEWMNVLKFGVMMLPYCVESAGGKSPGGKSP